MREAKINCLDPCVNPAPELQSILILIILEYGLMSVLSAGESGKPRLRQTGLQSLPLHQLTLFIHLQRNREGRYDDYDFKRLTSK